MIKGIDAQVMTQRTVEYTKDVSQMMRRDEMANEFADRMNKANREIEAKTVAQSEKANGSRINADQERGGGGQEQQGRGGSGTAQENEDNYLPSIGSTEVKLLDIEV